MDSLKIDNQLLIVNRSVEYRISKELICKIPYFEKMFCHDLRETKENKVVLDFDEKTFKIILDWIEMGSMYIKMDHVINLCTMVDYFGMNDNLIKDCFTYFHKNFSIEHLGTVMSQVTSTSKLVNSRALDAFICRYFLKIVNTSFWLKCHSATVLKICQLNLMISSECQVFEAIIKWLRYRFDYRKRYFAQLLASIRWCNIDPGHLSDLKENDLVKSADLVVQTCSLDEGCGCNYDRTKQNYFITIEELNTKNSRIKVLDSNFFPLVDQVFKWDNSLPLFSLPDEHVSDVVFDSGRKMIRIDWKKEKCRLLNYVEYVTYCYKRDNHIIKKHKMTKHQVAKVSGKFVAITGRLLLEANGKLILLRISNEFVECWSDPKAENINSIAYSFKDNFIATILDKNMYILTEALDFMTFKIDQDGELKIIKLKRLKEQLDFDDLFLTSGQAHDKVFLVDKSTGNVFCFNIKTQRWTQIGLLVNYNCCKTDRKKKSSKLLTFTSAFLSIDAIRPCLKRKLNSSN